MSSLHLNSFELPFEVLVIDDGSSDNLVEICKQYKKVKYHWKKNGGVASARNFGVSNSQYKYVAFLDSDDIWLPNKVVEQIKCINEWNLRFIGCGCTNKKYPHKRSVYKISPLLLPLKWWPHISTVIMEKNLFFEIGGFDENMRYAEDGDFFMKVAECNHLYCMKLNLVTTAIQKKSNYESGLSSNLRLMYLGELRVINKHLKSVLLRTLYYVVISIKFILRLVLRR